MRNGPFLDYQNGLHDMGVLQLAAAAQDATCCGSGRCVLRVFGV